MQARKVGETFPACLPIVQPNAEATRQPSSNSKDVRLRTADTVNVMQVAGGAKRGMPGYRKKDGSKTSSG
jgi:hypothetical protein